MGKRSGSLKPAQEPRGGGGVRAAAATPSAETAGRPPPAGDGYGAVRRMTHLIRDLERLANERRGEVRASGRMPAGGRPPARSAPTTPAPRTARRAPAWPARPSTAAATSSFPPATCPRRRSWRRSGGACACACWACSWRSSRSRVGAARMARGGAAHGAWMHARAHASPGLERPPSAPRRRRRACACLGAPLHPGSLRPHPPRYTPFCRPAAPGRRPPGHRGRRRAPWRGPRRRRRPPACLP
jgi:hypothetical protein